MLPLLLTLACAPKPAPPDPSVVEDAPAPHVEWQVDKAAKRVERVSMALLIGHQQGERVTLYPYGQLSEDDPTPPGPDTLFEIGSITKVFTGLLLGDAVVRGEATLDDPVSMHLTESWSLPEGESGPIRLVHLSTHTSGLPRMPPDFKPADPSDPYADYDAEALRASLAATSLESEPGEVYAYSNLGAGLLGFALAGDGEAYGAKLQERVLAPLGLDHTTASPTPEQLERLAPGHDSMRERRPSWHLDALAGAGQLRSTAPDLLKLAAASWEESALDEAFALSLKAHFDGEPQEVGLGWHIAPQGWWHNGGTGGYRSFLAFHPERECAIVVLATTMSPMVDQLGLEAFQALCGETR